MKIIVTLPDESVHEVVGQPGGSLMEFMRRGGIPVRAECGGAMACATCHVGIDPDWIGKTGKAGAEEGDLLDMSDYRADNSRLSCQVQVTDALDGLRLTLQLDAYE